MILGNSTFYLLKVDCFLIVLEFAQPPFEVLICIAQPGNSSKYLQRAAEKILVATELAGGQEVPSNIGSERSGNVAGFLQLL